MQSEPRVHDTWTAVAAPAELRDATAQDVDAMHALIAGHVASDHLLPRSIDEIARRAVRFVVATCGGVVVGCAELAPLSPTVAEVRSLAVDRRARGADAGATIPHPHGQIYAFPFVPPTPAREAEVAAREGCPLCAPPSPELLVHEGRGWSVAVPYASQYPYGMLLAPARHAASLSDLDDAERDGMAEALVEALGRLDRLFEREFPYMLWIHPGVHLHVHVAPPRRSADTLRYVASGEVGSGTLMNPVVPEEAAEALRNA
jgi:diadenosine tetraphosphate (Ap4A) HIT family hydrolase